MNRYRYTKGGILFGLIALTVLSSCQVMNRYKAPEVNSNNLYREMTSSDTTSVANIPWKEYFTDLHLISLIEEGIEKNHDLQIAYTRIQQAEANLSMAKGAYFPGISLVGQANQSRSSTSNNGNNLLGEHSTDYSLGVSVSWEIDVWGKLNRQSRSKFAQFLNSHAYKNLIKTSLIANIATSYYSLLALDEQLAITKETAGLLAKNVETMEALKESGLQNGAAVEQSKSLLYSTQASIPELENRIRQMENSISTLLGRKPEKIERSTIHEQQYPTELQYGVPVQMLAKRPDVQQAELSFRAAFELTNVAQASFYPSITLGSATIGYASHNTLSDFFKPGNIFASIIGGLTQPLFARKQLKGNLKIAKAQQQEALLAFEKTVLTAGQEVSDILYTFDSLLKRKKIGELQVETSRRSVYFTRELLIAGDANYTEVLTAEQNLLLALLTQVNDQLAQLQCKVNLYRALGGGAE